MTGKLETFARQLRQKSTNAEKQMWACLRAKRFNGLKFKRQETIGRYIVDFVCYSKNVIIELDGGQHAMAECKDKERDKWLKSQGFKVLRYWNHDVLCSMDSVLEAIYYVVKD